MTQHTITAAMLIQQVKFSGQMPVLIDALLTRQVILQAAQDFNLSHTAEELQQAADSLRLKYQLLTAEATWQWLQTHQLTIDEFERLALVNLLSTKLAQQLFGEAELSHYFGEHQRGYVRVVLYEVILEDADLALELFYAFQEGEIEFAEIARQYSADPICQQSGGYRGLLRCRDLPPEIVSRFCAAKPPELLRPIAISSNIGSNTSPNTSPKTETKTHLVYLESVMQVEYDDALRTEILSDLFANWLSEQVAQLKARSRLDLSL
jgi:parvulin-like peptidyl-prolyl isomerase